MWVFEDNSFVPCAKIKNGKTYSIITDHLGTPTQMYNDEGESVWERELDIYGKARRENRKDYVTCEFTYQGQYYDSEIDLCYNRFRYYDPEIGRYISEDPIGFLSGVFNFYSYVNDPNAWIDVFGLDTVYGRLRDNKKQGLKPYVGSSKHGIDKRYTKRELKGKNGKDHFEVPNHDIARGLEQIIYEKGLSIDDNYWDNKINPVSPAHKGGKVYKNGQDKYTYRTGEARKYMENTYGKNWESKIDKAFGF